MADYPSHSSAPIDRTTVISLLSALALLALAYFLSLSTLPARTAAKHRILYIWHAFDALIHFLFEAAFLYHCFFSHSPAAFPPDSLKGQSGQGYFLSQPERQYGAVSGTGPTAALWREYAKADQRWGGADLTIISIELLTVFGAGPLAATVVWMLGKEDRRVWFWMTILAVGELYGGFMTFAPEWLSGNSNLDTSNWLFLWVYLFFFNMLWVVFPLWALYEAYYNLCYPSAAKVGTVKGLDRKKIK